MEKSIVALYKHILAGLFLTAIVTQNVHSQTLSKINWTTDSELLPQNSIKSIVPDKYGFIWMTTENGLVRYDGKNFSVYNSQAIGIKSNRFFYIIGDYLSDSLYTSTDWDEQHVFIHQRNIQLIDPERHPYAVQFKKSTKDGRFTASGIPSLLLDIPKRPYHIPLVSKNYFHIDTNTIRFFNSKKQLGYELNFEYDSNSNFFALGDALFYMDKNGKYAVIENGTVKWHTLNINPKAKKDLYWNTNTRQIFIFSERTLYQLDYRSNKLNPSVLMENEDLDISRINSIYFDTHHKTIYLGSKSKGLGVYTIKDFKTITPTDSKVSDVFYGLAPLGTNSIISGAGIILDTNKVIKALDVATDKYAVAVDRNEDVWTYKANKLNRYRKEGNYKQHQEWAFDQSITSLLIDKKGKIWFSTTNDKKNSGTLYNFIPDENPVFNAQATLNFQSEFIAENGNNSLLLGSSQGLHEIDLSTKKIKKFKETEALKIRSIFVSSKKNIWISTYEKGFFLLKNQKTHSFPLDKNNYLLSSHCIIEDQKGFFWISTNKGLFQVKESSLMDYANRKTSSIYYHYYNKKSGFLTNEFNGGCQPCAAIQGDNIFFPSMAGVVVFNPNKIRPILPKNPIFIDEVLIDNNRINVQDTLNLRRNFNRVTFYITSPYYGNSHNLNFEAKLEGSTSSEWTKLTNENNISYTRLSPGEYQLVVRKLSGFDSKYDYKKIIIIIEPAFWETLWFRIVMIALIVLIGIVLYNLRMRFILKQNLALEKKINDQTHDLKNTISTLRATKQNLNQQIENNTKIIQYITHDIKSPLKFMAMASKYMYDMFEENDPDLKQNIQSIFTSSSQMFNFVDNLLEYSKVYLDKGELYIEEFNLYDVINEKTALFEAIANSKRITIKNSIAPKTTLKGNKHLFSIIIHNLLDNAIKNTSYGNILLYDAVDEEQTHISICDTGSGMDQSVIDYYQDLIDNYDLERNKNQNKIGLHIVVELLLILNGKMKIASNNNAGTIITLTFNNNI